MGRGIIQHPETKKYAIWSSIVDDFITDWLSEDELKQWQINEYAEQIKEQEIKVTPFKTFDECLHTIETYHGKDRVNEVKDGIPLETHHVEHKFNLFDFFTVRRNNTVISKDAFKDQDGKQIPIKWGTNEHPEIIGPAKLEVHGDGISMSISEETYAKLMKMVKEGNTDE